MTSDEIRLYLSASSNYTVGHYSRLGKEIIEDCREGAAFQPGEKVVVALHSREIPGHL
jgi:hypothetical protein